MRGAAPLGSKSSDLAPALTRRALRPSTPGDFLPDEKVTKESPRGDIPSGYSPEGDASLPLRFPHPLDRACTTKIDRFATLSWWANRSCFFL